MEEEQDNARLTRAEIRRLREALENMGDAASPEVRAEFEEKKSRYAINQGARRLAIIRELAEERLTQAQIARKWGVTPPAINQFKKRWQAEIDEVKQDLANEFATLYLTEKRNRLAEYQSDIEELNEADEPNYYHKHQALKAIAEELGALKQQIDLHHSGGVDIRINGVDLDDLK